MSDSLLRAEDRLFRYGGEEFAVLMPHTDEEGALVMAKRLRDAVYALQIPHVDSSWGRVTVSIGLKTIAAVCAYCEHSAGEAIVMGTDKALLSGQGQRQKRHSLCGTRSAGWRNKNRALATLQGPGGYVGRRPPWRRGFSRCDAGAWPVTTEEAPGKDNSAGYG